ncbi:MAG TPA: hypothetical protein VD962_01600, partial [Rubricoccaceae bacterium]|nr:hypothetical protein [Rubricoccaceae bacterium]
MPDDFIPPPPTVRDEAGKRAALRKMKRVALAALVAAAIGFVALHLVLRGLGEASPAAFWVGLAAAIFEAA